jgi:8-oxo-dGTP pyrophosphatase MutT (NUDIX family)
MTLCLAWADLASRNDELAIDMRTVSGTVFERSHVTPTRRPRLQSGVLAYRIERHGKVRILLVRTRRSKRWGIPKGGLKPGLSMAENAANEAFEEAGVRGEVATTSSGMYRTSKRAWYGDAIVEVWVYLLRVTEQLKQFPEKGQREAKWVSCRAAARMLREPLLAGLCLALRRQALQ